MPERPIAQPDAHRDMGPHAARAGSPEPPIPLGQLAASARSADLLGSEESPTLMGARSLASQVAERLQTISLPDRAAASSLGRDDSPTDPLEAVPGPILPPLGGIAPARRTGLGRWTLPLVGAGSLLVGVAGVFLVVGLVHRHGAGEAADLHVSGSVPASTATAAAAAPAPAPAAAPEPSPSASVANPTVLTGGCTVAGPSQIVAPRAVVAPGIEARAIGDDIVLGFAVSEKHGVLLRVHGPQFTDSDAVTVPAGAPIRRATPVIGKKGRLHLAIDYDKKYDPLQGRRFVALDPPVHIGAAGGQLAWTTAGHKTSGTLWPLTGEGGIEALRGVRSETDPSSVAIAYRHAGAVWVGTASLAGSLAASGGPWRLEPMGANIGSPTLAYNDGTVLVAWSDRTGADEPWRMRWVRFKANENPGAPRTFFPPPGGRGEQTLAPSLTAVPGGGFLLVWTEGPSSAHEVRALTLSADGAEVGKALAISGDGGNAGQGQAAIGANGRGLVAYLQGANGANGTEGGGFHVAVTPIQCPK